MKCLLRLMSKLSKRKKKRNFSKKLPRRYNFKKFDSFLDIPGICEIPSFYILGLFDKFSVGYKVGNLYFLEYDKNLLYQTPEEYKEFKILDENFDTIISRCRVFKPPYYNHYQLIVSQDQDVDNHIITDLDTIYTFNFNLSRFNIEIVISSIGYYAPFTNITSFSDSTRYKLKLADWPDDIDIMVNKISLGLWNKIYK